MTKKNIERLKERTIVGNLQPWNILNKQIVNCEIAPTGKAKCNICENKIPKGSPKIWFYVDWNRGVKVEGKVVPWKIRIKRGVCYKCVEKTIDYDINKQKMEIKRLNLIKKKFKNQIKKPKIQETIRNSEIMGELEK